MASGATTTAGGEVLADSHDEMAARLYGHYDKLAAGTTGNEEEFQGILEICSTGGPRTKKLALDFIPKFFSVFPTKRDEAFNKVLDLVEGADTALRLLAIRQLPALAIDAPNAVKVTDVLVQLLQSDAEQEEAAEVRKSLFAVLGRAEFFVDAFEELLKPLRADAAEEQDETSVNTLFSLLRSGQLRSHLRAASANAEAEAAVAAALQGLLLRPHPTLNPTRFKTVLDMFLQSKQFRGGESGAQKAVDALAQLAGLPATPDVSSDDAIERFTFLAGAALRVARGKPALSSGINPFLAALREWAVASPPAGLADSARLRLFRLYARYMAEVKDAIALHSAIRQVYACLKSQLATLSAYTVPPPPVVAPAAADETADETAEGKEAAAADEEEAKPAAKAAAAGAGGDEEEEEEEDSKAEAQASPSLALLELSLFLFHSLSIRAPEGFTAVCGMEANKKKVFTGQPSDFFDDEAPGVAAEKAAFKGLLASVVDKVKQFNARGRAVTTIHNRNIKALMKQAKELAQAAQAAPKAESAIADGGAATADPRVAGVRAQIKTARDTLAATRASIRIASGIGRLAAPLLLEQPKVLSSEAAAEAASFDWGAGRQKGGKKGGKGADKGGKKGGQSQAGDKKKQGGGGGKGQQQKQAGQSKKKGGGQKQQQQQGGKKQGGVTGKKRTSRPQQQQQQQQQGGGKRSGGRQAAGGRKQTAQKQRQDASPNKRRRSASNGRRRR